MKEKINHVDELNDPARRSDRRSWFVDDAETIAFMTGEFIPRDAFGDAAESRHHESQREHRSLFMLYGAILGVLEVLVLLAYYFGGH